ncbi:MAG TPA: hypothetical protein VFD48_01750 [Pyrinomonadaceae bacterium]|nr:hypothetical protein [Pyrinomonadaceae bacterium]
MNALISFREQEERLPDLVTGVVEGARKSSRAFGHVIDMPYNRAILRELVMACFDGAELTIFCSDHFGEVYSNFTDGQDKADRVLKLLDHVERHSDFQRLAELVKAANAETFKDFEARLTAEQETDPQITDALRLIQEELNRNPDYANLKERFEKILEQISLLSDYKVLHDGLHTIQYSVFQNILASIKIVLDDKYARDDLSKYLRDYRREVAEMTDAAARKKVDVAENLWITQLEQSGNELEDGIEKGDQAQMSKATETINQVIGREPGRINLRLYQAVYAYNETLPEPTDLMNRVRERINAIAPGAEKVILFQKGIDALKEINANLKALIAEHNSWQEVERELRVLPDFLADAGIPAFNKKWLKVRAQIEQYYSSGNDKSSLRLKKADERVGSAVAANDPEAVQKTFETYWSEASDRFFYVDKSVLALCESLKSIRSELD